MSSRRPLLASVQQSIRDHGMLPDGRPAVVAVSGGADSVCLLLALCDLSLPLVVAHLNHGLRGAEAEADAGFVRELCRRLQVPCEVEWRDVASYRAARKLSLEAAAREVRHAFLQEVAQRHSAGSIFLAHTADDQVETFLLRLIRGAGPAGLSGMKPRDGTLCRPLLGVWRREVEGDLGRRGQPWREDASNHDFRFLRNRVRLELLPLLQSLNPGVKQVLWREAANLGVRQHEVEIEVLRRCGLSSRQIGAALSGQPINLSGGRRLTLSPDPPETRQTITFDAALPVPGQVAVPGVGRLVAELADPRWRPTNASETAADASALGSALRVRSWRPGDRFQPLGMSGSKKLQDFFVDEHIPRSRRDRVPVLLAGDAVVWVAGLRLDDRFKLTPASEAAVRLRFDPC